MNVIYNGIMMEEKSLFLPIENRAFQYGDGIFETIISENGELLFIEDHFERLTKGLEVLKIVLPDFIKVPTLIKEVNKLLKSNGLTESARIKLMVWRKPGGLFSPTESNAEFLVISKEHKPWVLKERKLGFCASVTLSYSSVSAFKKCSSLPYILAGIEMKERGLDDIILLDNKGNVSECLYSNIFWVKNNSFFTPSLETGCIAGIRRKNLIRKLEQDGKQINFVMALPDELMKADYVFSTNVAGIYPITKIKDKVFEYFIPQF